MATGLLKQHTSQLECDAPILPFSGFNTHAPTTGRPAATRPHQTAPVSRARCNPRRLRTYSGSLCGAGASLARALCNFWSGARASEPSALTERRTRFLLGRVPAPTPHTSSKALHNVFEARTGERVKETRTTKAPPHLATGLS